MEDTRTGSVPIAVAARVYGKPKAWVRAGIIAGWLPIGKAIRNGVQITRVQDMGMRRGRICYYISPLLLEKETGYTWKGERR